MGDKTIPDSAEPRLESFFMGDKTIPDSAEPRLESFYPPFVAGIDLPHQGVVDSYNLNQWWLVTDAYMCHSASMS